MALCCCYARPSARPGQATDIVNERSARTVDKFRRENTSIRFGSLKKASISIFGKTFTAQIFTYKKEGNIAKYASFRSKEKITIGKNLILPSIFKPILRAEIHYS